MDRRKTPHTAAAATTLPDGLLWRRSRQQLSTRLGVFPGDRIAILAPATHDPTAHLMDRLPRVHFLRIDDPAVYPWQQGPESTGPRIVADATDPPFEAGTIESLVVVFAVPVHDEAHHAELVEAWAPCLTAFGRWHELVAVDGPRDPRLGAAEDDLREAGFEKVRTNRLALGRAGSALFLLQGRWPGLDDDDLDDDEDDDSEEE